MIYKLFHADSLASSFGRSAPWKGGRLQRPHSGAILILLALFIPIVLGGIRYAQYRFEKTQDILETPTQSIYYKKCAAEAALAVAKVWDCSKTLGQQKAAVYAAANAVYNSARTYEDKISPLSSAIPGFTGAKSGTRIVAASKKQVPASSTGDSYVKISVAADSANLGKITVQTDDDVASAVPAECNLDVVLAIPVNSTAKVDEIKTELKTFVDGFGHPYTRGVYAGVIPYSGKLSLPSGKYNGWTEGFAALSGTPTTLTLYDLFGTKGVSGTALSTKYDDSGSTNGYSIMCRSSLLDATSASISKYKRMNLNPCTSVTYDVFSNYKCPSNCTTYKANPHPIMELNADLGAVSTKVDGLSVPSDSYNTSNFIFAALEWSHNLFQSWTDSPQRAAASGGDTGTLGSQSQTTSGRKKAIILLVNKPDTFTAGEMTYLGRSDDADTKRMDLDWKEATLPSVAEWTSVCYGNGKFVAVGYRLSDEGKIFSNSVYSNNGSDWNISNLAASDYLMKVCYGNGKFVAVGYRLSNDGEDVISESACSNNGIYWNVSVITSSNLFMTICYGNGRFVSIHLESGAYSTDGISWVESTLLPLSIWTSVCYGNGKFVAVSEYSDKAMYSTDGISWTPYTLPSPAQWASVCYGNGKFVAISKEGVAACNSGGTSWTESTLPPLRSWPSVCYGGGKFVAVAYGSNKSAYSSDGIHWTESTMPSLSYWTSVCYGDGKFVAITNTSGKAAVGQFVVETSSIGNTALKAALGNVSLSGVKTLTSNACRKLKEAYGSNVRIYVIKYRKEGSDNDYTYLEDCATSTGGSSYDCANQAALKNTLATIAASIKTWAGRMEARNVN